MGKDGFEGAILGVRQAHKGRQTTLPLPQLINSSYHRVHTIECRPPPVHAHTHVYPPIAPQCVVPPHTLPSPVSPAAGTPGGAVWWCWPAGSRPAEPGSGAATPRPTPPRAPTPAVRAEPAAPGQPSAEPKPSAAQASGRPAGRGEGVSQLRTGAGAGAGAGWKRASNGHPNGLLARLLRGGGGCCPCTSGPCTSGPCTSGPCTSGSCMPGLHLCLAMRLWCMRLCKSPRVHDLPSPSCPSSSHRLAGRTVVLPSLWCSPPHHCIGNALRHPQHGPQPSEHRPHGVHLGEQQRGVLEGQYHGVPEWLA